MTFDKYSFWNSEVVHIGDEVDNHAISYHESKPDGHGAGREADLAQEAMYKWYKTFSNVKVCIGNHSALHKRKAQTSGLPERFIKSMYSIKPIFDNITKTERLIELEQHANLYPLFLRAVKIETNLSSVLIWDNNSKVNDCFLDQISLW